MKTFLKNQFKVARAGALASSPTRHTNLSFKTMVYDTCEFGEHKPMMDLIFTLVKNAKFEEVVTHIDSLREKALRNAKGDLLFLEAADLLTKQFDDFVLTPEQCEQILPNYEAWFKRQPNCPFAAATFGMVTGVTGYTYRGTGFNDTVTDLGWKRFHEYAERACKIMGDAQNQHADHWYWAKTLFSFSYIDSPPLEAVLHRFEDCQSKLPLSPSLYETIAFKFLPRWYGDFEMLESFISHCADSTKDEYGDGLYARIYAFIVEQEDWDDLHINPDRFRQGAKDWLTHFPSQFYQTKLLSTAFNDNQFDCALDLAETLETLETLHYEVFETGVSLNIVNSVCREFTGR